MGGEKENLDLSDLNSSLPAAAAGKPRFPWVPPFPLFPCRSAPLIDPPSGVLFPCSPQRRGPRRPRQCPKGTVIRYSTQRRAHFPFDSGALGRFVLGMRWLVACFGSSYRGCSFVRSDLTAGQAAELGGAARGRARVAIAQCQDACWVSEGHSGWEGFPLPLILTFLLRLVCWCSCAGVLHMVKRWYEMNIVILLVLGAIDL